MKKILKLAGIFVLSTPFFLTGATYAQGNNLENSNSGFSVVDAKNYNNLKEFKFRDEFGLGAISINTLSLGDSDNGNKFGIKLSKIEEEQLSSRIVHQSKTLPLVDEFIEVNGGYENVIAYIDQKSGGVLNVGIKNLDNEENFKLNIEKIYGYDGNRVHFFVTKYSEQDLNEFHDNLISYLNQDFNGVRITELVVNVPEQKVEVGVEELNEEKRKFLEDTFNSEMLLIREARTTLNHDRNTTFNPLQAGINITNTNTGGGCTIGFLAKARTTSSNFVITAGHCGTAGNSFKQGSNSIGTMGARYNSGNVDAATIGLSSLSYSNDLYTSASRGGYFDLVQGTNNEFVGEMTCLSGASTATNPVSCGVLKSKATSATFNGVNFTGLRTATYSTVPGDSGGPVYYSTILKGINKGYIGSDGVYSHISNVLSKLDVEPLLK
ncbi:S1 family peptidase [Paenibacillus sp. F6_3S_P_1C]|uniref:S1 family peptidase n=1 Tax=Paenibacillus vandeheii TaxID=3035917 RepID=A0ABT8J8Q6_9BACL|nr:S1 family peptidase [Paenibacillus vandeheii]MDN4601494.1 S1 family peptidase [Paenibacillus vandeheii]